MTITTQQIKGFLERAKIAYRWNPPGKGKYQIASLFAPVENGFYFFSGPSGFPPHIRSSLVMVGADFSGMDPANEYIVLQDQDPQQVFYQLLSSLFSRKSTGQIASMTEIDRETRLGRNVQIDAFCSIEPCEIGDHVIIGSNVKIHRGTVIADHVVIESGSVIGAQGVAWIWNKDQSGKIVQPQLGGVLIEKGSFLGAGTIIVRGSLNESTVIGEESLIAPGCRFGHGTILGKCCHFANNVTTGGNSRFGDYSFIGSGAVVRPKVAIHPRTIVGAGALVVKNTSEEGKTLMGVPAREYTTGNKPSGMPVPKI